MSRGPKKKWAQKILMQQITIYTPEIEIRVHDIAFDAWDKLIVEYNIDPDLLIEENAALELAGWSDLQRFYYFIFFYNYIRKTCKKQYRNPYIVLKNYYSSNEIDTLVHTKHFARIAAQQSPIEEDVQKKPRDFYFTHEQYNRFEVEIKSGSNSMSKIFNEAA